MLKRNLVQLHIILILVYTFIFFSVNANAVVPNDYNAYFGFNSNIECDGNVEEIKFWECQTNGTDILPVYNDAAPDGQAFTQYWKPFNDYPPDISTLDIITPMWNNISMVFKVRYKDEDNILPQTVKLGPGEFSTVNWHIKDTLCLMSFGMSYLHTYGAVIVTPNNIPKKNDTVNIAIDYGFEQDKWSQVVVTISAGQLCVWVDNIQVCNESIPPLVYKDNKINFRPLGFMVENGALDLYYKYSCLASQLDELYLYDRVLTELEIANIFDIVSIVKHNYTTNTRRAGAAMYSIRGQKLDKIQSKGLYVTTNNKILNLNSRNNYARPIGN